MARTNARLHVRHRLAAAGAAAAAVVLTATMAPAGPAAAESDNPGSSRAVPRGETVDVMTRNLYLGSSLDGVIAALQSGDDTRIVGAATQTWQTVVDSDPEERLAAIADEILEANPAVVGLQEVTTWTIYPGYDTATRQPTGDPVIAYDFLTLLLDELGTKYAAVSGATAHNFASPAIPYLDGSGLGAVQLADRDVILVRDDVAASNGQSDNFATALPLPLPTPPGFPPQVLPVVRGWGSADVTVDENEFRFVNAHTEAWGPEEIRIAQVQELFAAQAGIASEHGSLPVVYVGDYNTAAPDDGAYLALRDQLRDAWLTTNGTSSGYTCCQNGTLTNTVSRLDERIDLVLTGERVRSLGGYLTGTETVELPGSTQWASDHAGVVASLVIPAT